eukprot:scaffold4990_cov387-Prasinococcus_capsulatus_cf.AAC.4
MTTRPGGYGGPIIISDCRSSGRRKRARRGPTKPSPSPGSLLARALARSLPSLNCARRRTRPEWSGVE